jgi:hypothetical protein
MRAMTGVGVQDTREGVRARLNKADGRRNSLGK